MILKTIPAFLTLQNASSTKNDLLSNKRKETELKRLQTFNLELKFEVEVKFQTHIQHFTLQKKEHKTSPSPFEVHIDLERDLHQPTSTYGKIIICNPYSGLEYIPSF